jgi:ADP-heptose:LPS heptosyltransferase
MVPDDFFIELVQPNRPTIGELLWFKISRTPVHEKPICVLHTTGGDPQFRTYKYMADIARGLKDRYFTVQLGGANDFPAGADVDLRGKLSFRETAWVMSKASLAVTIDSFLSHLAGSLGVSQVCLFGSGNHNVVRPNQVRGTLICRSIDYCKRCIGLGPCSASIRNCPLPCTGLHDPKDILKDIDELTFDKNKIIMKVSG